mmetsp:Transcript_114125/g.329662  ORF Transcript_114125/g.329662 Transcript_114125/m.329662 type:complete len:259 (+) Transcript_114125:60-836(+)
MRPSGGCRQQVAATMSAASAGAVAFDGARRRGLAAAIRAARHTPPGQRPGAGTRWRADAHLVGVRPVGHPPGGRAGRLARAAHANLVGGYGGAGRRPDESDGADQSLDVLGVLHGDKLHTVHHHNHDHDHDIHNEVHDHDHDVGIRGQHHHHRHHRHRRRHHHLPQHHHHHDIVWRCGGDGGYGWATLVHVVLRQGGRDNCRAAGRQLLVPLHQGGLRPRGGRALRHRVPAGLLRWHIRVLWWRRRVFLALPGVRLRL